MKLNCTKTIMFLSREGKELSPYWCRLRLCSAAAAAASAPSLGFLRSESELNYDWSHPMDTAFSLVLIQLNLYQYSWPGLMLTSPPPGSAAQFLECLLPTEPGPGWGSSSASDVTRASSSHGFLTKHSWLEEQLMAGSGLKQDFKADEKNWGKRLDTFRK